MTHLMRTISRHSRGWLPRAAPAFAVALGLAAAPLSAATVVVPPAQSAAEGNANTTMPFNCASSSFASQRYQQVYRGSEVDVGGAITELRFRRDGFVAPGFGATTIPGVTITLSSTSKAPDGLSSTFADNVGGDVVTVFSGDLTLASPASGAGAPKPFDVDVPLETPFDFDPASGLNLLLDVTIPTCTLTNAFDAEDSVTDGTSIVRAFPSSSATATVSSTVGLVTQFVGEGGPPLPPGPFLTTAEIPGFRFKVRIGTGAQQRAGVVESDCIENTLCASGAIPGQPEVFARVPGPKPNGYLWPTLVKFTTSQVEVWIEQTDSGIIKYYKLPGAAPGFDELPGLFDRSGFLP
jgi:hypothetical protein